MDMKIAYMQRAFYGSLTVAAMAWFLPAVHAHHAISGNFDLEQQVLLEDAVLTQFKFVNPHVYLYLDVPGDDGAVDEWRCEMAAATRLRRRGWSAESLLPGQIMSIEGSPGRREANVCHVDVITLPDGTALSEFAGRPSAAEVEGILASAQDTTSRPRYLSNGQPNLRGPWVATQESLEMPETEPTPAGAQAAAGLVRHFDSPALTCAPANILLDWVFEREANDIVQFDNRITLLYGYLEQERTILLNQDSHPENIVPSRLGHSIGWWEGDELVVDTIGFEPGVLDHTSQAGFSMHSAQWHVVERYGVAADGLTLTRDYTFSDPLYMDGSYSGQDTASLTVEPYGGYDCEELSGENNRR